MFLYSIEQGPDLHLCRHAEKGKQMSAPYKLAPDYHAHIYFDADSSKKARALGDRISAAFPEAKIGR